MHTLMVILGGVLTVALTMLVGRMLGGASSAVLARWALYAIPIWFVLAIVNLWVGVTRAGYSIGEELPVFAIVFAVPAVVAVIVWWKLSRPG